MNSAENMGESSEWELLGKRLRTLREAFGCKVICYSASGRKYQLTSDRKQVDFDTILQESDILSIHAPLNSQTENLYWIFRR